MPVWDDGGLLRCYAHRLRPLPSVCVRPAPAASRATVALPTTTTTLPSALDATALPSAESATAFSSTRTAAATRASWGILAAAATAACTSRGLLAAGAVVA